MTGDGVLLDEGIGADEKRFLGQIMLTQFERLATLPPDEVHDVIDDALAATFDIGVGLLDEPETGPAGPADRFVGHMANTMRASLNRCSPSH